MGFIEEKFIAPLCSYYTLEATITYGLILVAAVYGVYKLLIRLNVRFDRRLVIGLLPFIIYGGWTRALRDHQLYQGWWWCSPPIYFMIFAAALGSLLLGLFLQKRFGIEYEKFMGGIGVLLLLYNASLTSIGNSPAFILIALIAGMWAGLLLLVHRLKPKLVSLENALITAAHMLDASASYVAITFFGYYEQHVLGSFLIAGWGTWTLFLMKLVVVLPVLYLIDKETQDERMKNLLKIVILILGLALGIRDWLTVSL
ncbi:MAG TPA: DUF63 family protein [archaeon]|nr:DUF63 family protein [archaeon]